MADTVAARREEGEAHVSEDVLRGARAKERVGGLVEGRVERESAVSARVEKGLVKKRSKDRVVRESVVSGALKGC